jgi:hypothetical protein
VLFFRNFKRFLGAGIVQLLTQIKFCVVEGLISHDCIYPGHMISTTILLHGNYIFSSLLLPVDEEKQSGDVKRLGDRGRKRSYLDTEGRQPTLAA